MKEGTRTAKYMAVDGALCRLEEYSILLGGHK